MKHARAILEHLSANPEGAGIVAISQAIGSSLVAAKSQLHILMLAGMVRATRRGRGALWFVCEELAE